MCYCLFITPSLWTFSVSNDLRACSSALFVMAERTPVVKKYRDALENVIGATMEFLAQIAPPNPNPNQDPTPSSPAQTHGSLAREPQLNNINASSPAFSGAAQESYVRASPKVGEYTASLKESEGPDLAYMHEAQTSPVSNGRWEGRHGELGQMDAEWLLGLCEGDGDGFNLQMLNEMMRFEPSLGA